MSREARDDGQRPIKPMHPAMAMLIILLCAVVVATLAAVGYLAVASAVSP